MSTNNKMYGLILPEKTKVQQPVFKATRNVFGNDSESDEESTKKPVLLRPSDNINRQAKLAQQNALTEDPTVFLYDEIYDSMTSKKTEKKVKSSEEKKPRYIENLMKSANKRKLENERRIERQIQKERENEGNEFADKEVFVTSAYKKKLEEMSLEEEREKREQYLESIGDVTKQSDLGGFYRHLYEQKLGIDKNLESNSAKDVKEIDKSHTTENKSDGKQCQDPPPEAAKKRNYRKRKTSENPTQLSEGEIEDSGDEINRVNLDDIKMAKKLKQSENIDADSDFTIDESSEDEGDTKKDDKQDVTQHAQKKECEDPKPKPKEKNNSERSLEDSIKTDVELKPKIDIWKKRTVGEVFEQALRRYYERKSARAV